MAEHGTRFKTNAWPDLDVRQKVTEQISCAEAVQNLREARSLLLFINSTGKWALQVMGPVGSPVASLTSDQIVLNSLKVDENGDARLTRATYLYDPSSSDASSNNQFGRIVKVISAASESPLNYGDVKEIVFQDCWTAPDLPVSYVRNMARRMLSRLRNGRRTVTFRLEMKDASLNVGDFISIAHRHIVSPTGALLVRPYVIIAKQEISESVVEYEAYDLAYAGRFARFMADTATDDYDTATATEKGLGCYFGDADNRVGELVELGYDFW